MSELIGTVVGALAVIAAIGVLTIGSQFISYVVEKVTDLFG